jgi:hypothetical protein
MGGTHSRRGLLTAAGAAIAGATAATLAGAQAVLAINDDGRVIHVGNIFRHVQAETVLQNQANGATVLTVIATHGGSGLNAQSDSSYGVYATSETGMGVYGRSDSASGVYGQSHSTTLPAVRAWSQGGSTALQGYSGSAATIGTPVHTGVYGLADSVASAVGVHGDSPTGRGGLFSGTAAQIRLQPSTSASHPHSGESGDLFLDKSHRLWLCKGGATWVKLA